MKLKNTLLVAVALLVVLSLSACSSSKSTNQTPLEKIN